MMLTFGAVWIAQCRQRHERNHRSQNQPQNKERILIKGAYLMTQDDKLGNFVGDVLVADGRILEIGRELSDDRAKVINGTGNAVLPGFIDTHRHNWQGALRNLGPAWTYQEYRSQVQIGLGQYFDPRDVHVGNLAADLMPLDSGVTTVRDESHISNSPEHSDAAIAAPVCVRSGPVRDPFRSPSVWYLSLDTQIDRMFVFWDLRDVRCRQ